MYNHYTTNTTHWVKDNVADGDVKITSGNVYSDYYASYLEAIEHFNSYQGISFCKYEIIYDYNEVNSYKLYIPQAIIPIQVL